MRDPTTPSQSPPAFALPVDRDAEVVVLDGGTATTLEQHGHVLDDALWSARLLLDAPEAIVAVHAAFLAAGAQVVTTASYQLAAASLAAAGREASHTERLLARAVELGHRAVADHLDVHGGRRALVAASVGPYGAVLADGSEYRGGYGRSEAELVAFHAPRIEALAAAGADVLACETIPSAVELAALARVLTSVEMPAYVSVTLGSDGRTTAEGQPLVAAFAPLLELDTVVAVGVNCCPPELVGPALAALAGVDRPLLAKPNAGARWDATTRRWVEGSGAATDGSTVETVDPRTWIAAGARLVGGCCGTSPDDLRALTARLGGGHAPRQP